MVVESGHGSGHSIINSFFGRCQAPEKWSKVARERISVHA